MCGRSSNVGENDKSRSEPARSVCFSPDGKKIAYGNRNSVRLVELDREPEPPWALEGHTDLVTKMVFAPGGHHVVSCGYDNTLRVWDLDRNVCTQVFSKSGGIDESLSLSRDGTILASRAAWDWFASGVSRRDMQTSM